MSFDLPANLERDLGQFAQAEHISPAEAVVRLLSECLAGKQSKSSPRVAPLTEEELAAFNRAFPNLDAMADVTDEQWDQVLRRKRQMDHAGLSSRA